MKKIMGPSVLIVLAVVILVLAVSAEPTTAAPSAPCTPCNTWGELKTCYTSTPARCCSCQKTPIEQTEQFGGDSLSGTSQLMTASAGAEGVGNYSVIVTDSLGSKDTCLVARSAESCGTYCTYTMDDWGSGCPDSEAENTMSTQPGCVRDHYFDEVFPEGVTIGDPAGAGAGSPTLYAMKFTNTEAVEDFLSSRGEASVLTADITDPATEVGGGVLAGQILALTLNLKFSCAGVFADLELLPCVACYADYEIPEGCGKFHGLTAEEFLAIANLALADSLEVLTPYAASLSDVVFTATCLNEKYDECGQDEKNLGYMTVPGLATDKESRGSAADIGETPAMPKELKVNQSYPNPFNPSATIEFTLPSDGNVSIIIYDAIGRKVATLLSEYRTAGYHSVTWLGKDEGGTAVASGVYFCRVQFGPKATVQKMILLR